ncbi:MAG: membrane protein insertase YidC [Bacteroidetes bacterium]|nr:MAG: membrane protein insertase YidC [Bacteroidota bacterium]TAG87565.1 MAG: membrane protein insertase YidC [Bacteroidota bacterium]
MDKNGLTGILLMFLLIMLYFQLFSPAPTPTENGKKAQEQQVLPQRKNDVNKAQQQKITDSTQIVKLFGDFAPLAQGKDEKFVLENKDVKITFQSRGGKMIEAELKNYKTHDKKPVILINEKNNAFSLPIKTSDNRTLDLYRIYYQAKVEKNKIVFKAEIAEGKYIEQIYELPEKGFLLSYQIKSKGLEETFKTKEKAELYWANDIPNTEVDLYQTRYYSTINYYTEKDGYNYLTWPNDALTSVELKQKVDWVALKQKFFSLILIAPNKNITNANLSHLTPDKDFSIIKHVEANLQIPVADFTTEKAKFQFYIGPNDYRILSATKIKGLEYNVYLGWSFISYFTEYLIIPLFMLLEMFFSNYGIIIILLVVVVKTFLLPLTYKSYLSMAKMKIMNDILKPELDAFKVKNNLTDKNLTMEQQQKVQQEQLRLYQEMGSSPFAAMSGCFPLLLQMPFLFAMFMFFPNAIEFRQQAFLWANDLSSYDSIMTLPFTIPGYGSHVSLFTILMTLSTLAVTYFTSQGQQQMQGPMKYMGYIFPIVFMFVLNTYPAGLSFYYLVQNVISIGQQQFIKAYFVDEAKIRQKFEDYKAANKAGTLPKKKKSRFMELMEDAQKKAKEQQEAKAKGKIDLKKK